MLFLGVFAKFHPGFLSLFMVNELITSTPSTNYHFLAPDRNTPGSGTFISIPRAWTFKYSLTPHYKKEEVQVAKKHMKKCNAHHPWP
jgi:hypothetical protein